MGKIRATKRDPSRKQKASNSKVPASNSTSLNNNESQLGKISEDISAISLGFPRAKILKKTNTPSNSSLLASNFASRVKTLNKQKKKVTFLENLIVENLKEQNNSEDAKHYFKVVHPSAIEKRRQGQKVGSFGDRLRSGKDASKPGQKVTSLIPDDDALISSSLPALKKIIKKSVKHKRIRLKATRETFKKKMELLKLKKEELLKAKQRQKTAIVGDMHPMLESLPDVPSQDAVEAEINETIKIQKKSLKVPKKVEKFSVKKTQQAMLDSLKFFEESGIGMRAGLSTQ